MKASIVLASLMFFAPASLASQVVCSGEYFGYTFTVSGKSNGSKIVGNASVVISDGDSVVKSGAMTVTSSSIVVGRSMSFGGGIDGLGQGTLNTTYDASTGTYTGSMDASTSMGNFNIDTTCSIH